jgi:hypothetical protein
MIAESYEQQPLPGLEHLCPPVLADTQRQLALGKARVEMTESMYQASGRTDPAHPMNGKYTGLWGELCLATGRAVLEHALLYPGDVKVTARMAPPSDDVDLGSLGPSLEGLFAIREQALADGAESIRLQREADRLRTAYFHGLASMDASPEDSPFAALGTTAVHL